MPFPSVICQIELSSTGSLHGSCVCCARSWAGLVAAALGCCSLAASRASTSTSRAWRGTRSSQLPCRTSNPTAAGPAGSLFTVLVYNPILCSFFGVAKVPTQFFHAECCRESSRADISKDAVIAGCRARTRKPPLLKNAVCVESLGSAV